MGVVSLAVLAVVALAGLASAQTPSPDSPDTDPSAADAGGFGSLSSVAAIVEQIQPAATGTGLGMDARVETVGLLETLANASTSTDPPATPAAATPALAPMEALGPEHEIPSSAATAIVEHFDARPADDQQAQLSHLDTLEDPVARELTDVLDAYLAYARTAEHAFAQADESTLDHHAIAPGLTIPPLQSADTARPLADAGVDTQAIRHAQTALVDEALDLDEILSTTQATSASTLDLCPALAVDLTRTDTTYTTNCALVVDAGGADTYHNNAGGSAIQANTCTLSDAGPGALVDLAGNDQYGNPDNPRKCGANGGGYLDTGTLLDTGGHDDYVADELGTNGGGSLGVGLLVDTTGSDTYEATSRGTNGGGSLGTGLLVDLAGDDAYDATHEGTNGGGIRGTGTLVDARGTDTYNATHTAVNGGAQLGTGLLLDALGSDDQYTDEDDGTGTDHTVAPKGMAGAQVDSGNLAVDPELNPNDEDGDNIPDEVEQQVCGRPLTEELIENVTNYGECKTTANYAPPDERRTASIPVLITPDSSDADNDGVPATATVRWVNVTVTPFEDPIVETGIGTSTQTLDPNDTDPDRPVQSRFQTPTALIVGTSLGGDADDDGLPANVTLERAIVHWDRRDPTNYRLETVDPVTAPIDPDPGNPTACKAASPLPVPVDVRQGDDADQDDVPATVTVERVHVNIHRCNETIPTVDIQPASGLTLTPDEHDDDPERPAPSTVTLPAAVPTGLTLGPDRDGDDVPAHVNVTFERVTVDRRTGTAVLDNETAQTQTTTLDSCDRDPSCPAPSRIGPVSLPLEATHTGDGDDDYVPGAVNVTWLDITIDRRTGAEAPVILDTHTTETTLDENDDDRDQPVPFSAFDGDGDLVPDEAEWWICQAGNDRNTDTDGRCVREDGTGEDGDGNNYVPPADAPNPWRMTE